MIHRDARGQGSGDLLLICCNTLDIDVTRHARNGDNGIKHEVGADNHEGDAGWKQSVREAVHNANYNEYEGIRYHDGFVSNFVNYPADQRTAYHAETGADCV